MPRRFQSLLLLFVLGAAVPALAAPAYTIGWIKKLGFNELVMPVRAEQRSSPLVQGSRLYVGTRLGRIHAFDARKGTALWTREVQSPVEADPALVGNRLYAGTVSGAVYALRADDGTVEWRYLAGHEVLGKPLVHKDQVIFTTANNQVMAVAQDDGRWLWQYSEGSDPDLSIRGIAGVAIADNTVYTGFSNGMVTAIDASNGRARWKTRVQAQTRFADIDSTPVVSGEFVIVAGYAGEVVALDRTSGKVAWRTSVETHRSPTAAGNLLLVAGLNGSLKALDRKTGTEVWEVRLGRTSLSPIAVRNGLAVTGDDDGNFWVVDIKARKPLWHYRGAVSGVKAAAAFGGDNSVYLVTNLGNLFRFKPN